MTAPPPPVPPAPLTREQLERQIDDMFTFHEPDPDTAARYTHIRQQAKELALAIMQAAPPCADRNAAIRKVREAVFTANAAIALRGAV